MEERDLSIAPPPIWKDLSRELGLPSSGTSDDLQARILSHLRSDSGHRFLSDGGSPALRALLKLQGLPMPSVRPHGCNPYEPGFACICGLSGAGLPLICHRCGSSQHRSCMGKAATMKEYECANCQLRQMEPFEQVVEVVVGASVCGTQGSTVEGRSFVFRPEMHAKLAESGDRRRSIQIRCVRLDSQGFVQHWPKDCTIYINTKAIYTLSQPPASSTRKRKDSPLSLSNFPHNSHNSIMVVKQKEEEVYAFGVFVVETLTVEELLNRYLYERILTPEMGKAFVKSRAGSSEDIQADVYRQPLVCPLTRMVPDIPARGTYCQHVQCFDLLAYVVLQEKTKTNKWHCPICFGLVLRITVDEYMKEIVERARKRKGCEAVEFTQDGGYRLLVEDMDAGSDEDTEEPGRRRPVDLEEEQGPVKRPKVEGRRLNWKDFKCLYEGLAVEDVYMALCYQNAKGRFLEKGKKVGIREVAKMPPVRSVIDLD